MLSSLVPTSWVPHSQLTCLSMTNTYLRTYIHVHTLQRIGPSFGASVPPQINSAISEGSWYNLASFPGSCVWDQVQLYLASFPGSCVWDQVQLYLASFPGYPAQEPGNEARYNCTWSKIVDIHRLGSIPAAMSSRGKTYFASMGAVLLFLYAWNTITWNTNTCL